MLQVRADAGAGAKLCKLRRRGERACHTRGVTCHAWALGRTIPHSLLVLLPAMGHAPAPTPTCPFTHVSLHPLCPYTHLYYVPSRPYACHYPRYNRMLLCAIAGMLTCHYAHCEHGSHGCWAAHRPRKRHAGHGSRRALRAIPTSGHAPPQPMQPAMHAMHAPVGIRACALGCFTSPLAAERYSSQWPAAARGAGRRCPARWRRAARARTPPRRPPPLRAAA